MNKIKLLSLTTLLMSGTTVALAQDFTDALRYSYLTPTGTARSMGYGNATGAVGGDFSSLSENPAGIGIYRNSEMQITPSLKLNSVDGSYQGNGTTDNNTRFNFNSVGFVFTNAKKGRRYERSKWKAGSFAIGVNRLADFNRDYNYNGVNSGAGSSSASEVYVADANANGVSNEGSLGYLGYQSYLVNYDSVHNQFYTAVPWEAGIRQARTVSETGGINELVLSFGGNYMEKLMLGATVGIPIIHYNRISTYSETALTPTADFSSYANIDNLTTNGTGIDLKLGAIYKPSQYFRIGLALHTPTFYTMHDEDNYSINNEGYGSIGSYSRFDYSMTTPWKGVVSAAGFLGKYGFLTAEYEYVDYSSTRFHYDGDFAADEQAVNQQIKSTLKAASNIKVGLEGRITDFFMIRLGFDYFGNPYQDTYGVDGSSTAITGGVGFRFDRWFIDLGYMHTHYKNPEQPYITPYSNVTVPTAVLTNNLNNAALTVGFKF